MIMLQHFPVTLPETNNQTNAWLATACAIKYVIWFVDLLIRILYFLESKPPASISTFTLRQTNGNIMCILQKQ